MDHPSQKYAQTIGGAFEIDGDPSKVKFFDRHKGGRCSVLSTCDRSVAQDGSAAHQMLVCCSRAAAWSDAVPHSLAELAHNSYLMPLPNLYTSQAGCHMHIPNRLQVASSFTPAASTSTADDLTPVGLFSQRWWPPASCMSGRAAAYLCMPCSFLEVSRHSNSAARQPSDYRLAALCRSTAPPLSVLSCQSGHAVLLCNVVICHTYGCLECCLGAVPAL